MVEGRRGWEKEDLTDPVAMAPFCSLQDCKVFLYSDLVSQGTLKVSSNQAMLNSLTDASTETFWESSGESRGNFKKIDLTFEEEGAPTAVAVHIDNTKDTGVCCVCVCVCVCVVYVCAVFCLCPDWCTYCVPMMSSLSLLLFSDV